MKLTQQRILSIAVAAAVAIVVTSPTSTVAAASAKAAAPEITIDGRAFGPEDGLVVTKSYPRPVTNAMRAATTYAFGSSYARTSERIQLYYNGESLAAANVFNSRRIVQVCFQYTRDGSNVGGACSNASFGTCPPSRGSVATKRVIDSLVPNAPQTRFSYSTSRIDPNVC